MRRRAWLLLLAFALACGQRRSREAAAPSKIGYLDESSGAAARDGGTLYRRLEGEPSTLNGILQTSDYETFVISEVSRNLIDFDKNLKDVGGLCDRWEVSSDGRSYTLHLRDSAVWEDGTPVSSRDAVYTIGRVVDPNIPAALYSPNFEGLAAVSAVDEKTFRVAFREPYAFRLYAFNMPLLPASRYEKKDLLTAPENRAPLSNGPYRFVSWKTSESIELARNERYWGDRPHFDRVIFRVLPDNTQAYRALKEGSLDEMRMNSEQWRESSKDAAFQKCCRVTMFYDLSYFFLGYNNRSPLFADARTRRALSLFLDRAALAHDLYFDTARPLSGPWAASSPAYDSSVAPDPFDPASARRLLAEAGWKADATGVLERKAKKFDFELLYGAGSVPGRQISEVLKRELETAGIVCRPRPMEAATLFKRMDDGDFEAVVSSWSADPNPDPYANWHSSQAPPHGLNNLSYSNPEADRLMEAARREFDPARRGEIYHRLHRVIHDDAPATFAFQAAQKYALSRRVGGVVTTPIGLFKFWPDSVAWWDRALP
jgi:peptide/nickel transport system substrate-binding protein